MLTNQRATGNKSQENTGTLSQGKSLYRLLTVSRVVDPRERTFSFFSGDGRQWQKGPWHALGLSQMGSILKVVQSQQAARELAGRVSLPRSSARKWALRFPPTGCPSSSGTGSSISIYFCFIAQHKTDSA